MPDPVPRGRARGSAAARLALALGASCFTAPADAPRTGADAWLTDASREVRRAPDAAAVSTEHRLSVELDSLERSTLAPLASSRPPAVTPHARRDIPLTRLDLAHREARAAGVAVPEADARLDLATPPGLARLASTRASVRLGDTGSSAEVRGPTVATAAPVVVSGAVSDVARVVAGLRAGFRSCYASSLNSDPSLSGVLRVTFEVGPDGSVVRVRTTHTGALPPSLIACIAARAQQARFSPPLGGGAVLGVPVTFVPH